MQTLVVLIIVVFAGITVAAVDLSLPRASGAPPQVLAPTGTAWNVPAGQYEYVGFSSSNSVWLSGSVSSSALMSILVLNEGEFTAFGSHAVLNQSVWDSGAVSEQALDVGVGSGQYYLVFVAASPSVPLAVEVTSSLEYTASN